MREGKYVFAKFDEMNGVVHLLFIKESSRQNGNGEGKSVDIWNFIFLFSNFVS